MPGLGCTHVQAYIQCGPAPASWHGTSFQGPGAVGHVLGMSRKLDQVQINSLALDPCTCFTGPQDFGGSCTALPSARLLSLAFSKDSLQTTPGESLR